MNSRLWWILTCICEATRSKSSPAYNRGWMCISSLLSSNRTMEACLPCSLVPALGRSSGLGTLSPPPPIPTPMDCERTSLSLLDNLSMPHFESGLYFESVWRMFSTLLFGTSTTGPASTLGCSGGFIWAAAAGWRWAGKSPAPPPLALP